MVTGRPLGDVMRTDGPLPPLFQAMRESLRYLAKSKSDDVDSRVATVNHRIEMTEKFVAARQLIATDAQRALDLCNEILFGIPVHNQVSKFN